eukprot:199798_1
MSVWLCTSCGFTNNIKQKYCQSCFNEIGLEIVIDVKSLSDIFGTNNNDINKIRNAIVAGMRLLQSVCIMNLFQIENTVDYINKFENEFDGEYKLHPLHLLALHIETGHHVIITQCDCCDYHIPHNKIYNKINEIYSNNQCIYIKSTECRSNYMYLSKHQVLDQLIDALDDTNSKCITFDKPWTIDMKTNLLNQLHSICITAICQSQLVTKSNDRNLKEVLDAFYNINGDILRQNEVLNRETMESMFKNYELALLKPTELDIDDINKKNIAEFNENDISKWSISYKALPFSERKRFEIELVAVLSRAMKVHNDYYPRTTQLLPIFAMIRVNNDKNDSSRGLLYEVGTGEGKSVIVVLLCSVQRLLYGKNVDNATSQSLLAEREVEEQTDYFNMIGLNVKYIDESKNEQDYSAEILYSTSFLYQCDILRLNSNKKKQNASRLNRLYEVCIVDESDNSFIDLALQSARLSSATPGYKDINIILVYIYNRMKLIIQSVGTTFRIGNSVYFYPSCSKHFFDDISPTKSQTDFAKDIAKSIIQYLYDNRDNKDNKDNYEFLMEYGLFGCAHFNDLHEKIEKLMRSNPRKILQLISCEKILNLKIMLLKNKRNSIGFECYFENGMIRTDATENINSFDDEGVCCLMNADNINDMKFISKVDNKTFRDNIKQTIGKEVLDALDDNNSWMWTKGGVASFIKPFIRNQVSKWTQSCWSVIFFYELNRDYKVDYEKNKIVPVDSENTGLLQYNTHYSYAVHELLQIKHHLKMSSIGTCSNMMTNACYFNLFEKVYGLTGTLGKNAEIKFYKECFNVNILRIPSFKQKQNIVHHPIDCNNDWEWMNTICLSAFGHLKSDRAVLIINKHIKDVNDIKKQLEFMKHNINGYKNVIKRIYVYAENDDKLPNKLCAGSVVIATNLAGRGTDIKLDQTVNDNGGLHVILTFIPQNNRIEKQAIGRTARAGNPGSNIIIFNKQKCIYASPSTFISKLFRDLNENERMKRLQELVQQQQKVEKYYKRFMQWISSLKADLTDYDKEQILFKWSIIYETMDSELTDTELSKIYDEFIGEIQSKIEIYEEEKYPHRDHFEFDKQAMHIKRMRKMQNVKTGNSKRLCYNPHYLVKNGLFNRNTALLTAASDEFGYEYRAIAEYNKAYSRIHDSRTNISEAISCMEQALDGFKRYLQRAHSFKQFVENSYGLQCGLNKSSFSSTNLGEMISFEIAYWMVISKACARNISTLKWINSCPKPEGCESMDRKARVSECRSIDDVVKEIPNYKEFQHEVTDYYQLCGMCCIYKFEKIKLIPPPKPRESGGGGWSFWGFIKGAFKAVVGALEIVGGVVCCCCGFAHVGIDLIMMGIEDTISGVQNMWEGKCDDFGDWAKNRAKGLGVMALGAVLPVIGNKILSTVIGAVSSPIISLGKTLLKIGKKLKDSGIIDKIKNGEDLDIFDAVEVGTSFVDNKSMKYLKKGANIAKDIHDGKSVDEIAMNTVSDKAMKNIINVTSNVIRNGHRIIDGESVGNVMLDTASNCINQFGNNDIKNIANKTKDAIKIAQDIKDGKNIMHSICNGANFMGNALNCDGINVANDIKNGKDIMGSICNTTTFGNGATIIRNKLNSLNCDGVNVFNHLYDLGNEEKTNIEHDGNFLGALVNINSSTELVDGKQCMDDIVNSVKNMDGMKKYVAESTKLMQCSKMMDNISEILEKQTHCAITVMVEKYVDEQYNNDDKIENKLKIQYISIRLQQPVLNLCKAFDCDEQEALKVLLQKRVFEENIMKSKQWKNLMDISSINGLNGHNHDIDQCQANINTFFECKEVENIISETTQLSLDKIIDFLLELFDYVEREKKVNDVIQEKTNVLTNGKDLNGVDKQKMSDLVKQIILTKIYDENKEDVKVEYIKQIQYVLISTLSQIVWKSLESEIKVNQGSDTNMNGYQIINELMKEQQKRKN